MASMRVIKRRIRSVGSTQQITKAMNLVAASKLQKARTELQHTRPFFEETRSVIASVVASTKGLSHAFLKEREVKNTAVIIITGNRGLCGGYNVNVSKEARRLIRETGNEHIIMVGSKGRDYFRRRKKNIVRTYTGISEVPYYEDASEMGALVTDMFLKGEVDQVYICYTKFKSIIAHEPTSVRLLPVLSESLVSEKKATDTTDEPEKKLETMSYEPNEVSIIEYLVPKFLNVFIYGAMVESAACELGARMTSMDSATSNATEMIDKLTLQYNRARQGAITQEINEIVSGANALE